MPVPPDVTTSLGPSRQFLHVRMVDGRPVVDGCTGWTGGAPIPAADDEPDGVFAQWSWDGAQVVVRIDRMGFFPIYYFADQSQFCISPSLPLLLERGAPRELDTDAIGVFLRLG